MLVSNKIFNFVVIVRLYVLLRHITRHFALFGILKFPHISTPPKSDKMSTCCVDYSVCIGGKVVENRSIHSIG